jgi:hypothetical protein
MARLLRCLGVIGVLAATLACAPAWAFDVDRGEATQVLRFGHISIAVFWRPRALGVVSVGKVEAALRAAIETWNKVPGVGVELVYGGEVTGPTGFDIYVDFETPYQPGGSDPLARIVRHTDAAGRVQAAEIVLDADADVQWLTTSQAWFHDTLVADLQGTLTHMLGHALGLGHSRDTRAAMYFFRPDYASRQLTDDDRAGLRWLWPSGAPDAIAVQCDACQSDADCLRGRCFAWPDGSRHCLEGCDTHGDCPLATSCGTTGDGLACLPNDRHCRADAGTASVGGLCHSDLACPAVSTFGGSAQSFCMTGAADGWCTFGCSMSCPSGASCISGLCRFQGPGARGAPCLTPADCALGGGGATVCAPVSLGGGRCTRACASDSACGNGGVCSPDGHCTTPGGGGVGWPCASGFDCASGRCLPVQQGPFSAVCVQPCEVASDCPPGSGCFPASDSGGKGWCRPAGPQGAGQACVTSAACSKGLACDLGGTLLAGVGVCAKACEPLAQTATCGEGQHCVWQGDTASNGGACRANSGGGEAGTACSTKAPCRADLVCAGADRKTGTCSPLCDPKSTSNGCGEGLVCAPLSAARGSQRGVCAATATLRREVPLLPTRPDNFAAIAVQRPDVVLASKFVFEGDAGGCSARPTAAPLGSLVGAGLVCGLLWRRRARVGTALRG